jgi:hypothetical protein
LRKDSQLEITDRIRLGIFGGEEVLSAAAVHEVFIVGETLAALVEVGSGAPEDGFEASRDVDLDGRPAVICLSRHGG